MEKQLTQIQILLVKIKQAQRAGNHWQARELDKQLAQLQRNNRLKNYQL